MQIETPLREIAVRLNLWLAPLVPAYYVARVLAVPPAIAILAGASVELTGLAASYTTMRISHWNKAHPDLKEQHGSVALGSSLIIIQLIVSCSIAVGLELYPAQQALAPIGFAALAACSYLSAAMLQAQIQLELAQATSLELSKLLKRFWKVVKERQLPREQAEIALLEAGGDPVAAIKLLPVEQPTSLSYPKRQSEPKPTSNPIHPSEPAASSYPMPHSEPPASSYPSATSALLVCPRCLSPFDRRGQPWKSAEAVRGHQRFCSVAKNGNGTEIKETMNEVERSR